MAVTPVIAQVRVVDQGQEQAKFKQATNAVFDACLIVMKEEW